MIDPDYLSVKELVSLWEKITDADPLKGKINARLDYLIGDLTLFSREDFFDRMNNGQAKTVVYFLPRSNSFEMYGRSVTIWIDFSMMEIEIILEHKEEDIYSFDNIRIKSCLAPHFDKDQAELMAQIGFNPMHVYEIE